MAASIPERFRAVFWDTDIERLDPVKNRDFIITRLFTKGGTDGILYAQKTYSREEIAHAARTRRDLDPIMANFLSKEYNVPREEMAYYRAEPAAREFWNR